MNKIYIVLTEGFGDDAGTSIHFATLSKAKVEDIERLWKIVQNHKWKCPKFGHKNRSMIALETLQKRYGIITWSGRDLRIEEIDLK